MRPIAPILAALLLSAAFAGCFGSESGDGLQDLPSATAQEDEGNLTNVSVDDGTTPMSVDAGHQPHIHDYWAGRERATLMDEAIKVDETRAVFFTFVNTVDGAPAVGGTFLELPDGAIVYEGTGQLEFTLSWTDATVTGAALRYQSAASTAFSEPQPLTNGEPLVIEVTPEMTDMPHGQTSRWAFVLQPAAAGQALYGTLQVRVEIVKMRDVSKFPGHPELFHGANTLQLFKGAARSSQDLFVKQIATFLTGGSNTDDSLLSEKVVPMETLSMTANVTITSVNAATGGEVSQVWFLYKPADTNGWFLANEVTADPATQTYQFAWPVEMEQTDSPYAETSQWRFMLRVGTEAPVFGGACGGCSDVQVDYEAEIVAYDSRLAEAGEAQPLGGGE